MLGGGLGSQPSHAELLTEFIQPTNHSNYRRDLRILTAMAKEPNV
jgi:hypothetical protein